MGAKLNEKAVVVKFNTSSWGAAIKDEEATAAVREKFGTEDSGYFTKKLMKGAVKKVNSKITKLRKFHNENTVPWDREGGGLLLNTNYFDYVQYMNQGISEFNSTIENEIVSGYEKALEDEKVRHGNLFNPMNYPAKEEIAKRYKIAINFEPVPSVSDFRFDIQSEEVEKIRKEIENRMNDRVKAGMADVWNRLYKIVEHMNFKLKEYSEQEESGVITGKRKKNFHDSTIGNVEELARLLPKLNIAEDEELDNMAKRIIEEITNIEADELRKDSVSREEVIKKTEDVMEAIRRMENYM